VLECCNCITVCIGLPWEAMLAFCSTDASPELLYTETVCKGWPCTCSCKHSSTPANKTQLGAAMQDAQAPLAMLFTKQCPCCTAT
jgi:hypothetical protein